MIERTSDNNDLASEKEEQARNIAIKHFRKDEGPKFTGFCPYCEEPLEGKPFCNIECRDEWQEEQRILNAGGK